VVFAAAPEQLMDAVVVVVDRVPGTTLMEPNCMSATASVQLKAAWAARGCTSNGPRAAARIESQVQNVRPRGRRVVSLDVV
jgi:hypothetical protein